MLVDIIFRGTFSKLNFSFLESLLVNSKEVRFNDPAIDLVKDFEKIIAIIKSHDYFDLVINTDFFTVDEKTVPKVFINLSRNKQDVEILFFFDLDDLKEITLKESLNYLKEWMQKFQNKFGFEYFICQIDNANEDEYYFDIKGFGKLYNNLS